jgi:hypothetical protein
MEKQHGDRVGEPVLFAFVVDPPNPSAIPSFFETKESGGVQNRSEKNRIVVF